MNAFADVFVPGVYDSGTGQVAILIGLIAFYLSIPLGLAYYVRHRTGTRVWRVLHRFVIVVYVLSAWHTILYSSNAWYDGAFRTTLWLFQVPIAVLLLVRLLAPAHPDDRLRRPTGVRDLRLGVSARLAARGLVALTIVVLLAVPLSGRDGGRTRGGETADPVATPTLLWIGLALLLVTIVVAVRRVRRRVGAS